MVFTAFHTGSARWFQWVSRPQHHFSESLCQSYRGPLLYICCFSQWSLTPPPVLTGIPPRFQSSVQSQLRWGYFHLPRHLLSSIPLALNVPCPALLSFHLSASPTWLYGEFRPTFCFWRIVGLSSLSLMSNEGIESFLWWVLKFQKQDGWRVCVCVCMRKSEGSRLELWKEQRI